MLAYFYYCIKLCYIADIRFCTFSFFLYLCPNIIYYI